MWHAVESALNLLDLLLHWRFYVCLFAGLAVYFLLPGHFPDPEMGHLLAVGAAGLLVIVGLVWELRS